jgi:hypothetical protein
MTAHIAQSSARCRASQTAVIQALAPVIGPCMSRAITAIHTQETIGSRTSSTTTGVRSYRKGGFEECRRTRLGSGSTFHRRINTRQYLGSPSRELAFPARDSPRMAIPRRLNKTYRIKSTSSGTQRGCRNARTFPSSRVTRTDSRLARTSVAETRPLGSHRLTRWPLVLAAE